MARSFKLPDLGEGIHEGEILAVMVSVGDEVNEDDPILEDFSRDGIRRRRSKRR
jgi:pyruvate dehydrogenase E2 component (dihydrolipoamide acetyltransferase)